MTEVTLCFIYQGRIIKIQCKRDEHMKDIFKRYAIKISKDSNDIYFMSNGNKINEESRLEDINSKDNEIKILVFYIIDNNNEKETKLKDYKIILNKCLNKHSIENILLDEFNDLQNNKELNTVCNNCKKNKNDIYNNLLYKCCYCKINICPLCKSKHNKEHKLIDYELKNYLCIRSS